MAIILKSWNALLAMVLTVLGFSSCGKNINGGGEGGGDICEYGVPTAHFVVSGVVSDEDGNPIEGISVTVNQDYEPWTGTTDAEGKYESSELSSTFEPQADELLITMEDIDGEENGGLFRKDIVATADIKVTKVSDGSGAWDVGTFNVTANKTLTKE